MRNTVPSPQFQEKRSDETERASLVNDCKKALDYRYIVRLLMTTAGTGTYTSFRATPWGEMPDDSAWSFDAYVLGRAVSGGAARALYHLEALFYRESGAGVVQEGATVTVASLESVAAFDARFLASGNGVSVQVLDDGVRTMDWTLVAQVSEVK